jgi:hypothetical protein
MREGNIGRENALTFRQGYSPDGAAGQKAFKGNKSVENLVS